MRVNTDHWGLCGLVHKPTAQFRIDTVFTWNIVMRGIVVLVIATIAVASISKSPSKLLPTAPMPAVNAL
jgi:hypothetical protein